MGTLPQSLTSEAKELPAAWVERIFQVMEDRYGTLWADRYGAFPRARVMQTWARDLADMTRDELARGLAACRNLRYPPTLPEFRSLCRPPVSYERAYVEAVEQMQVRLHGGKDTWSSAAIFWAATKIGNDLFAHPYPTLEARWQAALDRAMEMVRAGKLPDKVPERRPELPAPGQCLATAEVARENLQKLRRMLDEWSREHAI